MKKVNLILILNILLITACNQTGQNEQSNEEILKKERKEKLISVVEDYIEGIKKRDFSIIPYSDSVTMRSPFTKNGMSQQLKGKAQLYNDWWGPLLLSPNSKEVVFKITDFYFNESLTSIVTESIVTDYNAEPPATVYVAERFTVDELGKIVDQINHIDVRDVLTPGWQEK